MNKTIIILLAIVVVFGGGWYLFKQSGTEIKINTPEIKVGQEPVSNTINIAPAPKVKEFTISGGAYFFNPKVMEVNKGDTVKITLVNSGGFHDLTIDEFNVRTKQLEGGQSEMITFVADKSGSFEYYCSVGSHRAMGMKGTLTVK